MKHSLNDSILSVIEGGAIATIDIVWAMSTTKPESYRRLRSLSNIGKMTIGTKLVGELKVDLDAYRKYHSLLSRLRKQGMIESTGAGSARKWLLSKSGAERLRKSKTFSPEALVGGTGATIISYDIPENQRRERGRLRDLLKVAEFEQVHQSLWHGKKKVTKEFLKILKELKVLPCVHIFEVSKSGSLAAVSKILD